jgi:D-alanyl-D-alanine carboxypeptidase/D-alanyl-D-alanine-endopeptidase (penicillin-binding protein 4)
MKKVYWFVCLLVYSLVSNGQTVQEKLKQAADRLQTDPQMRHAILGLSIVNANTGEKVFEVNPQMGLAPASCQKIITSATAMELLGPAFRYKTILGYKGEIIKDTLEGELWLSGSGDPSLGSWRYESTKDKIVLNEFGVGIQKRGIKYYSGTLFGYLGNWEKENIPGGWIWDDIWNYYGAGAGQLNWKENQYDVKLTSSSTVGSEVKIDGVSDSLLFLNLESRIKAAPKGSGDNAYIYLPPNSTEGYIKGYIKGTIPIDEKSFTISGANPDPSRSLINELFRTLSENYIMRHHPYLSTDSLIDPIKPIYTHESPTFDSLNYWFMKKSINLYGEAFLKTMAFEKTGRGSTEKGIEVVKQFWKERGIEPSAIHIIDGSGLSPQNRVTADALVKVLQFARSRPWFNYYYEALPVYNQMKLKSGTIGGAKSFAGYHTSKEGVTYTVAILVNNFDGSSAEMVKKMFLLLDELK